MHTDHLKSSAGFFAILELDNIRQLAESLGLDLSLQDNIEILIEINRQLLNLSKEVTGIVFDPIYTFQFLSEKAKNTGALIRLEQDRENLPDSMPFLFPNFSLEEISNNYALAKLELHYHPSEVKAAEKKQLLAEIREYSKILKIDFLLKLKLYDPNKYLPAKGDKVAPTPFSFEGNQLTAIQELRSLVDILVIQNPSDPLAMATIISELDIPCLVMADEVDTYETFKEKFRMAMENGAKGYCLGQVLWQEIGNFRGQDQSFDLEGLEKYLATTVRDRLMELNRIASESLDQQS
jgi:tagatose-1,6-bisphosphate aldolase